MRPRRSHHGLTIIESPVAKAIYGDVVLRESPLDCLLIENSIVLIYTALFDNNDFNMNRSRSCLKALNMHWGVAANFGKSEAQFTGVRRL